MSTSVSEFMNCWAVAISQKNNVSVDLMVGERKISSIKLPKNRPHKTDTIRRLAAKALIQELQHEKPDAQNQQYVVKSEEDFCLKNRLK